MGRLITAVTAQGQISVPVDVRRLLGIGPGSVLEWEEEGGNIVVSRAGKFSFLKISIGRRSARKSQKGSPFPN